MSEKRKITKAAAIKEFFGQKVLDYPVRVPDMAEFKALTPEERQWLGTECIKALGCEEATIS